MYPWKPQFYYIKVLCKGVFITWACFHDKHKPRTAFNYPVTCRHRNSIPGRSAVASECYNRCAIQARTSLVNELMGWITRNFSGNKRYFRQILPGTVISWNRKNVGAKYTVIFQGCKNGNFQLKECDIFLIFAKKISSWVHARTASVRRF